ncbi:MAG: ornithine--oxo-acid transaminase [Patescibacteria group bacterium]
MSKKTDRYVKKTRKFCAHNYTPIPVVLSGANGVHVYDCDGKEYLDMMSCYSALPLGHGDGDILDAFFEQAEGRGLANCSRAFFTDRMAEFAEKLCEVCQMEVMLPMNTGAEAVETAIKIARKWGYKKKGVASGKAEIIVCDGNFHGRTTTIIGFSSEKQYRDGFGPFTPGFVSIPFGDRYALKSAINENTVAFLAEPIQGEAGIIVPPDGFLKAARRTCTHNNVLFIADEIQTGLGRTGEVFACDHEGVTPDMYILGKALGGGLMPVSAVVSTWGIMDVIKPGDHGSTFGGGPLASAVATAYLKLMTRKRLADRAKSLGEYFMSRLRELNSPFVEEIRGKGLLIGIELKREIGGARPFCEKLMEEGLLTKETHDDVIRLAPPLIITKKEINWALKRIKKVLMK